MFDTLEAEYREQAALGGRNLSRNERTCLRLHRGAGPLAGADKVDWRSQSTPGIAGTRGEFRHRRASGGLVPPESAVPIFGIRAPPLDGSRGVGRGAKTGDGNRYGPGSGLL